MKGFARLIPGFKRGLAVVLALLLTLAGCFGAPEEPPQPDIPPEPLPAPVPPEEVEPEPPVFEGPSTEAYIREVVEAAIEEILEPEMGELERVKAAFDYVIELGYYHYPVALDIWRIRSSGDTRPTFIENRGLGFLLFGLGTCEDYSAALILLLQGMGIEARYLPGLTYSVEGALVHHAWVQARVDGVWYHMDVELEDGISNGTVRYKYFMKGDGTMGASHYWGQNLIDAGFLEADQNAEIAQHYLGEPCPRDYPTPSPTSIPVTSWWPDDRAILAVLQQELAEYEQTYGELDYLELDILPPVFGRYGGYWTDGYWTFEEDDWIRQGTLQRLLVQPE